VPIPPSKDCAPVPIEPKPSPNAPSVSPNAPALCEGGTATVPSLSAAAKRYYANVGTDVT